MRSAFYFVLLTSLGGFFTSSLKAQSMFDPASVTGGRTRVAPILSLSSVDYERENGSVMGVDRKALGVELSHGFAKTIDGVATFGLSLDTEADGLARDDGGFSLGVGARGVVFRRGPSGAVVYGFLNWLQDKFKGQGGVSTELRTYDLRVGGTYSVAINGQVQPFIGLDLAVLRDGTEKVRSSVFSYSGALRKDDILAVKVGVNILAGMVMLRPELTLLGEQTLTVAAGFSL